ncbi:MULTISPECIES: CXXX repeat peptide modification system protein [Paenibacillus]|uniref:CXXX repeat peptide modification system protein n=2 Tax=Paenibacillus riograndensis TaxID=483937 RepID=A0A132TR06_9BACL|nr:CXXX repeat peptide modification system protein [Paenibacillus riograndensis]KWX73751.1 hypothetical protein AMQ84_22100 [Paenibacillus riograndensis]CQR58672.1 hypothetical protein PRIO_6325 [Paenibacillus riograndensis SBR5]
MSNEKVGIVSEQEKDEILNLYERKTALQELFSSLPCLNNDIAEIELIYEKIVADLGKTTVKLEHWWSEKARKYTWKSSANGSWKIDFNTNEIFLIKVE